MMARGRRNFSWVRGFSALQWLLVINVAVFVVVRLLLLVPLFAAGSDMPAAVDNLLAMPTALAPLAAHCWTLLTHMFTHIDLWHIIINMLWLWWMGNLFMEFFTERQLLALYVLGGLGGAAATVLAYAVLPVLPQGSLLIGASGAVTAIMLGITAYRPTYRVNLFIIGSVELKWVAIVIILIDVLCLGSNTGGHIDHLGGAAVGLAFGLLITRGTDITRLLTSPLTALAGLARRKTPRRGPQPDQGRLSEQQVDAVLDKVRRSGYDSLSAGERELLARASREGYGDSR